MHRKAERQKSGSLHPVVKAEKQWLELVARFVNAHTHMTRQEQADAMGIQVLTRTRLVQKARDAGLDVADPAPDKPAPDGIPVNPRERAKYNLGRVQVLDDPALDDEARAERLGIPASALFAEAKRLRRCGYWVGYYTKHKPTAAAPQAPQAPTPDPQPATAPQEPAPQDERPWYAGLPVELWPEAARGQN